MKSFHDSQSKTGAFQEKNDIRENSVTDLHDVTTGRKIVIELTMKESITILQNAVALNAKIHYLENNVSKEKKLKI